MRRALYLLLGLAITTPAHAQMWQDVQNTQIAKAAQPQALSNQVPLLTNARQLRLNTPELQQRLSLAPEERISSSNTNIQIPLPDGSFANYTLFNSPIMSTELAKQYPSIQTYKIIDPNNPANTGRLDFSQSGFHAMLSHNGKTIFIDPIGKDDKYQSYYKSDYALERADKNHSPINCLFDKHNHSNQEKNVTRTANKVDVSYGTNLRTYRIAIAATGEYSVFHANKVGANTTPTKAITLAAIVTALNRINEVFATDLSIKLELIANNSDVIYTNAATDPYTDNDPDKLIDEVEVDLNAKIGLANYDIGHVFSTGGGGLAGFGVVCGLRKAAGVTGRPDPINDPFYIDFVAHELGHQFRADHTFNGTASSCAGGNREATAAYEPGGATTIMGYAGICGAENVQTIGDDYYHNHSLAQISEFVANPATGGSCGASTLLNNAVPVVDAGTDGNIPASTPFSLTGSATDADGDNLTYIWEQYDLGGSTSSKATFTDDGARPLFRSFPPSNNTSRTFPQISDVLSSTTTYGEILPTTDRDLNFRFTVRDSKGGVTSDSRKLTVKATAGPFKVTAPASVSWAAQSSKTVTWDVTNTDTAPISCANVAISLSTDSGQSFGQAILASTANDGSEAITVPNNATTTGRVRVACATQPFFAISTSNFTITAAGGGNTDPVANNDSFTVDQDSVATNFTVLGNDTDTDNDTLSITSISNISNGGTATVNGTSINYQPAAGFSGTETFTYAISDGNGGTDSATVTVTVTAPNANTAPVANDDNFTIVQDSAATSFTVLGNDTDADSDTLSITGVSNISNGGTATVNGTNISYQPAAGFSGTETFTYDISDGNGGTDSATVTVTVTVANNAPVANNDSFTVTQNSGSTSFAVLGNDTDADSDTLSITGISNISRGGTVTISGTNISYRPATGVSGSETFTYTISDSNGGSDTATVTVTITPTSTGGGGGGGSNSGGGSFGLFLLLLLGLGGFVKYKRTRELTHI